MIIRPATPADADALADMHVRSWRAAYAHILPAEFLDRLSVESRCATWRRVLAENESRNAVAEIGTEVVGLVSFGRCRDEGAPLMRGEVWAIYTIPELWGRGTGSALLRYALQQLDGDGYTDTSLWVLSKNDRAIGFYEQFGFEPVAASTKRILIAGIEVEELQLIRRDGPRP